MEPTVNLSGDKCAFVVVTDMHENYKTSNNRISYENEMQVVRSKIIRTVTDYKKQGYDTYVLFLGDIFTMGYREVFKATAANNFFILLRNQCDGMFSVIGNHELTYYAGNPFYTLVKEMNSERLLRSSAKIFQPKGLMPVIDVVDRICAGDTVIHFNHYNTGVEKAEDGKVNVGLFHQSIVCKEILDKMDQRLNDSNYGVTPVDFDNSSLFDGFTYCFFGHMHKVYGTFKYQSDFMQEPVTLQYLASLGRPNRTEVNNAFLERDVPVILVENGKYQGVKTSPFYLLPEEDCIKFDVVDKEKEKYEKVKERKIIKNYNPITDEPVKNLVDRCAGDASMSDLLNGLLTGDPIKAEQDLKQKTLKYLGG